MVSLTLSSSSRSSSHASSSTTSLHDALSSPARSISSGSASSSSLSLNNADEENVTITVKGIQSKKGKQKSVDDIHLLAISTRMTELSYAISDIQTRIFEIQELRHNSQSGDTTNAPKVIDQSLSSLDERLKTVSEGIKTTDESLQPLLDAAKAKTPTLGSSVGSSGGCGQETTEKAAILRKHAALLLEWEAVQKESQVLREELKEDKWLTVFRTVTEQADGMMASLEKAVNRCQEFIYQVQKYGVEDAGSQASSRGSVRSEKTPLTYDVFMSLTDQFEAKKKHYMPATAKVLSIIDKGVQDRVTKNGECLRRHAESTQRWRNLQDRITRTEAEMDKIRDVFLAAEQSYSEVGSSVSGNLSASQSRSQLHSHNGYLATPSTEPRKKKKGAAANAISRSMSPLRKLARKIQQVTKSPIITPTPLQKAPSKTPSSAEPLAAPTLRHRASLFNLMGGSLHAPTTPDRPTHKYSHSLTPESSPSARKLGDNIGTSSALKRPAWNSSTRVEDDERVNTIKPSGQRRPSVSVPRQSEDGGSPYKRSLSRSSMASSRPWSPVTSSVSTAYSSNPLFPFRPPSRAQTPNQSTTMSPRSRPKTPSYIPAPAKGSHWRSVSVSPSDADWDNEKTSTLMSRHMSLDRSETPSAHPRPPSRSMIPVPSFQIQSASRPGSAMSQYRPESSMSFRGSGATPRPSTIKSGMPPSSFKDSSAPRTPVSRPSSRAGTATTGYEGQPVHLYVPVSIKDPLDNEVAMVVNSLAHTLIIERVDPPMKAVPKDGEEIRAQYAFTNTIARKVVTCKLTTLARAGGKHTTKKVMCRVGGGWQDLQLYIINRQSGI